MAVLESSRRNLSRHPILMETATIQATMFQEDIIFPLANFVEDTTFDLKISNLKKGWSILYLAG